MNALEEIGGPLFRRSESGFDEERARYQAAHPHHPAVIVGATGAADVQAAVRYAADEELPVAVQATGHGLGVPLEMDALAPWTLGHTPNFRYGERAAQEWPDDLPRRDALAAELDPKGLFQQQR